MSMDDNQVYRITIDRLEKELEEKNRELMAKDRELFVESSLEKVRASAIGMYSSDDLSATVNIFFNELKQLGLVPFRCGVAQVDEFSRTSSLTSTSSSRQGESFDIIGTLKQEGHPVLESIFDHWKSQQEYYPVLQGADIKAYYNVVNPQMALPAYADDETQYGNFFYFKEGFVFAWTEKKLPEEDLKIFRRFTTVLSLTYRRYADLKKAEAQARESKIEAALERVRARALAMQQPEELKEVAQVLRDEMGILGVEELETCTIFIKDSPTVPHG